MSSISCSRLFMSKDEEVMRWFSCSCQEDFVCESFSKSLIIRFGNQEPYRKVKGGVTCIDEVA